MALKIYDTLKPQGDYPAVEAADVRMPDGKKLSDWKPESSGGASSWNELKDKPFYEESNMTILMEERTIEDFLNDMGFGVPSQGLAFGEDADAFTIVLGETYTVLWDGKEYSVTARDASAVAEGALALGNGTLLGLSGNGEPFLIGWVETEMIILSVDGDESTSHTVGIYQDSTTVKTLDAKYLPMEAIDDRIETYISAALEGDY